MNDAELVRYLRAHATTERALVRRDHACRLHHVAGRPCPGVREAFVSIGGGVVDDLLSEAEAAIALCKAGAFRVADAP